MEARVKILLVDDNPTIRKLLARSLEKAGDLVIASDGADALMKAIEEKPDLIISDYSMPVMDGRALLGKLREREETKAIPFVFLASQKEIDEQLRMLVEGVEDYFVKPFFVSELSQAASPNSMAVVAMVVNNVFLYVFLCVIGSLTTIYSINVKLGLKPVKNANFCYFCSFAKTSAPRLIRVSLSPESFMVLVQVSICLTAAGSGGFFSTLSGLLLCPGFPCTRVIRPIVL